MGPGAALALQAVYAWRMDCPSTSAQCGQCDGGKGWEPQQLR